MNTVSSKLINHISPMLLESIVEQTLGYLGTTDLKCSRFVCRIWNEEASKLLKHRKYAIVNIPDFTPVEYQIDLMKQEEFQSTYETVEQSKRCWLFRAVDIEKWSTLGPLQQQLFFRYGFHLKEVHFGVSIKNREWDLTGLNTLLNSYCNSVSKLRAYDYYDAEDDEVQTIRVPIESTKPLPIINLEISLRNQYANGRNGPDNFELFWISVCQNCPHLKVLRVGYVSYYSVKNFISAMSLMNRLINNNLEKLSIQYHEFISSIKFQQLRVLRLENVNVKDNKFELLLRNLPMTLKTFKLHDIFYEENNASLPSMFIKVVRLVPQMESFTWSLNPNERRSFQLLLRDIEARQILHPNLKYLKIEQRHPFAMTFQIEAYKIENLVASFPNLRELHLWAPRPPPASPQTKTESTLMHEFNWYSKFPNLERLTVTIDDISCGEEQVFQAVSLLSNSSTLRHLQVINHCKICMEVYHWGDRKFESKLESFKEMLFSIKHLESICLVQWQYFLNHISQMKEIENYVQQEGINFIFEESYSNWKDKDEMADWRDFETD